MKTLTKRVIYNVILNNEGITLKDLRAYLNVSLRDVSYDSKESKDFKDSLNSLIEEGAVVKSIHHDKGLMYKISDAWKEIELGI